MLRPHFYNPPDMPIEVIHKDSSILVINKPTGILTVPGSKESHKDCLLTRIRKNNFGALLVHRLDMDTSGIIVFARTSSAQINLGRQFENRKAKKLYMAKIWGKPRQNEGLIDVPLTSDWKNRPRQKVCLDTGKQARTKWRIIQTFKNNISLVELQPITGRSHQLRLHMASIGHPIIGDSIYAHDTAYYLGNRLNLHSTKLTIFHPKTGQLKSFFSPCTTF